MASRSIKGRDGIYDGNGSCIYDLDTFESQVDGGSHQPLHVHEHMTKRVFLFLCLSFVSNERVLAFDPCRLLITSSPQPSQFPYAAH